MKILAGAAFHHRKPAQRADHRRRDERQVEGGAHAVARRGGGTARSR